MELVISVIIGILITEVYAWLPRISQWLVDQAALRLPAENQDRYREEWHAYLDGLPNTVAKIVHAISYHTAIHRINADIIEGKLREIDDVLNKISNTHRRNAESIHQLKLGRRKIVDFRDIVRKLINDASNKIPDGVNTESLTKYRKVLYEFGKTMIKRITYACELRDRVSILTDAQIDHISKDVDRLEILLSNIYEQRTSLDSFSKFWFSSNTANRALENFNKLVDALQAANTMADDGSEEEDPYAKQHNAYLNEMKNITAMLQRVTDTLHKQCQ